MTYSLKIFGATVIVVWAWIIVALAVVGMAGWALIAAIVGDGWISVLVLFVGVPAAIGLIAIANTLYDWRREIVLGRRWRKL